MPDYIDVPIVVSPDDLAGQAFDHLQSNIPGWLPNDGGLVTILIEAIALIASVDATLASGVPTSAFRWFGNTLAGITPVDATPATTTTTWTVRDSQGYTIPAGTNVGIRASGDVLVAFQTLNAVEIPAGDDATTAGAVTIVAVTPGAAGSGLGTADGTVELVDPLDWVVSISQTAGTTGGIDAETDAAYLNRLRSELQLLTPRPILTSDFEQLARNVAGVARALAIDGYNPGDDSTGNPRMVAVAAIDTAGNAIGSGVKTTLATYLDGLREVNFVVNVFDPTYTQIDVTFAVAVADGFDPDTVTTAAAAAVTDFLSPANWGLPPTGDTSGWIAENTVRYTDLVWIVRRTDGVDHIVSLFLNAHTAAGTFTVTIASPAVFTLTAHGLTVGDPVILETTGALPTGLAPDVVYYVQTVVDANTFKLAATKGGSAINTTGSQSGTHSLYKTGTADVTLTGQAALPNPHTIIGTHT